MPQLLTKFYSSAAQLNTLYLPKFTQLLIKHEIQIKSANDNN
jgi:hypothetical protein